MLKPLHKLPNYQLKYQNLSAFISTSIVTSDGDKIVYKNNDEHTSPIKNTYAVGNEYLVVTENTIYVLSKSTRIVN